MKGTANRRTRDGRYCNTSSMHHTGGPRYSSVRFFFFFFFLFHLRSYYPPGGAVQYTARYKSTTLKRKRTLVVGLTQRYTWARKLRRINRDACWCVKSRGNEVGRGDGSGLRLWGKKKPGTSWSFFKRFARFAWALIIRIWSFLLVGGNNFPAETWVHVLLAAVVWID